MGRHLSKAELIHMFREQHGLRYLGHHETTMVRIAEQAPPPLVIGGQIEPTDNIILTDYQFDLRITHLGRELYAYVLCGDMVIVPPFEWLGYEFLSGHVW